MTEEPLIRIRDVWKIYEVFQHLNHKEGITVVLVTHEPDIADCAARAVTFCDGQIISDIRQPALLSARVRTGDAP